jgi:hypothetical protein
MTDISSIHLSPELRKKVFEGIMATSNRIGDSSVRAYIRHMFSVPSGKAIELTDVNMIRTLIWCQDQLISRIPTQKELQDRGLDVDVDL